MLTLQDFVGAKENFILRGLSETRDSHTVFLIKHCDELGERELEELIKLLDYDYRRKFKLLEPTVCLDPRRQTLTPAPPPTALRHLMVANWLSS